MGPPPPFVGIDEELYSGNNSSTNLSNSSLEKFSEGSACGFAGEAACGAAGDLVFLYGVDVAEQPGEPVEESPGFVDGHWADPVSPVTGAILGREYNGEHGGRQGKWAWQCA